MAKENKSTSASIVSALAAVLALAASGFLAYYASTNNDRMQLQEQRLERQETQQYASKVYLGEVPQSYYEKHGRQGTVYAVHNTSGIQVDDVWVEGAKGERAKLGMVQRCTLYSLTFTPTMLHFRDAYGAWRRGRGTPLEQDNVAIPDGGHGGTTATEIIENCSG